MSAFVISKHAVDQYRERVVACCERRHSDRALRRAITEQIEELPWTLSGGETFVVAAGFLRLRTRYHKRHGEWTVGHVTHQFLVECSVVVTVLGFMMQTDRHRNRRKRMLRLRQQFRAAGNTKIEKRQEALDL